MALSYFANDVRFTGSYDNPGRLLIRSYPNGSVEHFGYPLDVSGPTRHTNQMGDVGLYHPIGQFKKHTRV